MPQESSKSNRTSNGRPNNVRASRSGLERRTVQQPSLDDVDQILLEELSIDARVPNNALAAKAGIAPSTCLTRIRALRERGVIRGFHADIDPALAGRPLQAMVSVRIQPTARSRLSSFLGHLLGVAWRAQCLLARWRIRLLRPCCSARLRGPERVRGRTSEQQPGRRAHRDQPDLPARPLTSLRLGI